MYCKLSNDCALRAWKFVNHAMYHRYLPDPIKVDDAVFDLLLKCDGEHDLTESDALNSLV